MTTCNRCGKTVGTSDWDIHTCTPKPGWCDDCETRHQALEKMAQNARELGLDYEPSENTKAAYQRGYLDGMAKPCVECSDRQWVWLTSDQIQEMAFTAVRENWDWLRFALAIETRLKEKNT
jgi:hypothetical protein